MQLYDVLAAAQSGRAIENLAAACGVAPAQMEAAIKAIVPAFTQALERNTLSRGGLADLVQALGDGHHEHILDHPEAMADPRVREDGNAILGHVLGSKDRSRALAVRAAQASGLGEDLIKMLLPYLAQMLMGAIAKWAKGGFGDVMRRLPGSDGPAAGGGRPSPMPGGGGFELPRSEMPPGGYPMPPIPEGPIGGGLPGGREEGEGQGGDLGMPRPRQEGRRQPGGDGGGLPFPFPFPLPFPLPGGERGGGETGGTEIPWPRPRPPGGPMPGGGGGFELPRSEMPRGGYPMPPIPGDDGGAGPLPIPSPAPRGGGQAGGGPGNPYGDLSDILRRGGKVEGASAGSVVRDALGGLLGFGKGGVLSWIVRLVVLRLGWGLLRRFLGRALTGR